MFKAYFTDCRDIGRRELLIEIAAAIGLDTEGLKKVLEEHRYLPVLEEASRTSRERGVPAAPTFFFEGGRKIVGTKPVDVFRKILRDEGDSPAIIPTLKEAVCNRV